MCLKLGTSPAFVSVRLKAFVGSSERASLLLNHLLCVNFCSVPNRVMNLVFSTCSNITALALAIKGEGLLL